MIHIINYIIMHFARKINTKFENNEKSLSAGTNDTELHKIKLTNSYLKGVREMPLLTTFGVIGGDERMRYLASGIAKDGYPVYVTGLEKMGACGGAETVSMQELMEKSSVIILPLPATRDGKTFNAPYSEQIISLDDSLAEKMKGKIVYGGMLQKLISSSKAWREIGMEDYYGREELAVGNAIPTAEGALGVAIKEYPGTLNGSECLVTGFGRIGKNLSMLLHGMGAKVSAAARKKEDLMLMRSMGVRPLKYREISEKFDIIFNTVPTEVIGAQILNRQGTDTLIIELASAPGGIDRAYAEKCGIRVIDAPSLPGITAPKTAAEYSKEAIYNMLEE